MKKNIIFVEGNIADYDEEEQKFISSCEEFRWDYCNCFCEYLHRIKALVVPAIKYTPIQYVVLSCLDVEMYDDISISEFDKLVADNFNLWNYSISDSSEIVENDLSVVMVEFTTETRLVQIPDDIGKRLMCSQLNKLGLIDREKGRVCRALSEGYIHPIYETKDQLSAFNDGINFVCDTLSNVKESSVWDITFMDGEHVHIEGTDIFSVIFKLHQMGYAYEEAVTFDCLSDE